MKCNLRVLILKLLDSLFDKNTNRMFMFEMKSELYDSSNRVRTYGQEL